jgi:hypothetical protein
MITSGEIAGAGTIIGVQYALMLRAGGGTAAHGGGPGAAVGMVS